VPVHLLAGDELGQAPGHVRTVRLGQGAITGAVDLDQPKRAVVDVRDPPPGRV
jgi:hypothetical protein